MPPAAFKVIVPSPIVIPSIELPNPIRPPVLASPPKTLVSTTGSPEANGMIAPAP
jgi:hypothetical protein